MLWSTQIDDANSGGEEQLQAEVRNLKLSEVNVARTVLRHLTDSGNVDFERTNLNN